MMTKSVYIHIPFCSNICAYCDFCKLFYTKKWIKPYLKSLEKEIISKYKGEVIETIYIGGGTPSCLSLDELKILFNIIDIFKTDLKEFTFECNIEDINEELLEFLKNTNVNRLSIGLESTKRKNLEYLGRKYSTDFKEKIELACKYFDNINVDLIYALKTESLKDLEDDLDFLISMNIKHISTYSLIIEEHTKFRNEKNIDEDLDYEMYKLINKKLSNYHHYEVSNFCLKGYESKHNLVYWNNDRYYGFGLGASGFIDDIRYDNNRNILEYINGKYLKEYEKLEIYEDMQNEMILGLRKLDGVSKKKFYLKYGKKIENVFDIKELLNSKKLIDDGEYIYISLDYIYLSNEVLINFV